MTLRDFWIDAANHLRWVWTAYWWTGWGVIVRAGGRSWDAKCESNECPAGLECLGCNGTDAEGRLRWIGWDLDVGHGRASYPSNEAALDDARRIRNTLEGRAEIRLSQS